MITDGLEYLDLYLPREIMLKVKGFIEILSPDMVEGYYPISGNDVYARVMSYETKEPELCEIEAHTTYIDIQATLSGAEGIAVFPRKALKTQQMYDPEKDVELFEFDSAAGVLESINTKGRFTMLFPHEAHRPKQIVDGYTDVKKFVIKIAIKALLHHGKYIPYQ